MWLTPGSLRTTPKLGSGSECDLYTKSGNDLNDQVQGRGYALTNRLDRRNGGFACGHSVRNA